ncbi:hypothetical protein JYB65_13385 [Clostridium aminobutyricum]|uniref:ABC-transporter type IV n=2 Tax=Clostridium aminobutyricum TaxID=33953 RepID=A0A939DBQ2_CLOAM|nr:hypothetical protein [Clostridium aminobutyricum]
MEAKKHVNLEKFFVENPWSSFVIFCIGAIGYGTIEILFRGYTHWSMILTGGACLLTLHILDIRYDHAPLVLKAIGGALIITAYEFAVGIIVNLLFHFNVWDYSAQPLDVLGQICALFTFLWFLLCLALLASVRVLNKII